ncbi:MAG: hypothetical protein NT080_07655 [Spirochaetes bacterium]|nr:hypothetical protein [Spirochaetota bacterium]
MFATDVIFPESGLINPDEIGREYHERGIGNHEQQGQQGEYPLEYGRQQPSGDKHRQDDRRRHHVRSKGSCHIGAVLFTRKRSREYSVQQYMHPRPVERKHGQDEHVQNQVKRR